MENNKNTKQAGFTLQSILIGIVVLAILGGGVVAAIQANITAAQTENVKTFFTDGMNNAVSLCYLSKGATFTGCTTAELQRIGGLDNATTVWNDTWAAVATATNITITYPLDGFGTTAQSLAKGTELQTALDATNAPIAVTRDAADGELTVVYTY